MRIRSSRVYLNEKLLPAVIEIVDSKIILIDAYASNYDIDYGDNMLLPGFIDIHTHGYAGHNASRPNESGLEIWADALINEGVTSFLATTGTQAYDANIKALESISNFMTKDYKSGANLLGINLEGNFINYTYRGAQDQAYIVKPDSKILEDYIKASKSNIKSVICAVEFDQDFNFLKYAHSQGLAVSVGHSGSDYQTVKAAVAYGLSGVTHTGNGMRPFHHRDPGVFGAAMNIDQLYAEVIVDGLHLDYEVVNIIGRLKGKDKLILITDSSSYKDYAGQEAGYVRYLGSDGSIRNAEGNLSGSSLRFNHGVKNALEQARLDFTSVINAATINPATYLGLGNSKGLIKENYDADIIVVNDDFEVIAALVNGIKQK